MPHDCTGKLIKLGDYVQANPMNRTEDFVVGRIVELTESQFCSGQIRWPGIGQLDQDYFDAKDCTLILKGDGSDKLADRVPVVDGACVPD
ncbi:hypothetical protein LCGC14_0273160 [marine sediment metagenome]|uniref:Uncharacterized protein n=2 Tax=root TaxID=1 RepID=A0A9C9TI24_9HYPH|nr:hypothetical protein [Aurantimonas coralicida]